MLFWGGVGGGGGAKSNTIGYILSFFIKYVINSIEFKISCPFLERDLSGMG